MIDYCSRAPFPTLLVWHRASRHVSMLEAIHRTYGSREARVWLMGRVILDYNREFRANGTDASADTESLEYTK